MNRTSYVKHMLVISQVLFLLFSIPSCSQEKTVYLTIGTGGSLGNYYPTGRAIARIVNKKQEAHGFRLQEKETPGSVFNIDAIMAGDIEFGIAQADRQYQAVNGLAEWKSRGPQKDLRAVFSLYTESVTLVATRDSGMRTIQDLRGKRVDIGHPDSGIRQNSIDALAAAGIDWKKDITVYGEKPDNRTNMYLHGKLDAFFHTVAHPSTDIKFAANSVPEARFIPLVNIEKLLSKHPYYSKSFIPIELYPSAYNKQDVETVGIKATFLTSAKVPDDVVYAITKAILDDFESVGEHDPVMNTFRKESMLEGITAPIHAGALRYYKEIGLQLPDGYAAMMTEYIYASSFTLRWDAASAPDIAGYKIYYKTDSTAPTYNGTGLSEGNSPIDVPISKLDNPNSPEIKIHGLRNNNVYHFVLTTYDNEGRESGFSKEMIVIPTVRDQAS